MRTDRAKKFCTEVLCCFIVHTRFDVPRRLYHWLFCRLPQCPQGEGYTSGYEEWNDSCRVSI